MTTDSPEELHLDEEMTVADVILNLSRALPGDHELAELGVTREWITGIVFASVGFPGLQIQPKQPPLTKTYIRSRSVAEMVKELVLGEVGFMAKQRMLAKAIYVGESAFGLLMDTKGIPSAAAKAAGLEFYGGKPEIIGVRVHLNTYMEGWQYDIVY